MTDPRFPLFLASSSPSTSAPGSLGTRDGTSLMLALVDRTSLEVEESPDPLTLPADLGSRGDVGPDLDFPMSAADDSSWIGAARSRLEDRKMLVRNPPGTLPKIGVVGVLVSWSSRLVLDFGWKDALPLGETGLESFVAVALRPDVGGPAGTSVGVLSLVLLDREDSFVDDLPGVFDEEESFLLKLYTSV